MTPKQTAKKQNLNTSTVQTTEVKEAPAKLQSEKPEQLQRKLLRNQQQKRSRQQRKNRQQEEL